MSKTYTITYRETITFRTEVVADSVAEAKRIVREHGDMMGESLPISYGDPTCVVVESIEK